MKKIYNVLLTFLLICTLIPINVSAEGEGDFSTPTDTNITETDSSVVETNSNEDLCDDNINTTQDETSSETLENAPDGELAQEVEINQENNEETEILEEKAEENYPIFSENKTIDGVVISVNAEEGVFPEGSKLSVEKVVYYVQKQVDNALNEVRDEEANVVASYTFDIKILDSEGNEIQPKDDSKVKVSFSLSEVTNDNLDTNVYHIDDKQEEITSDNVQALEVITEGEEVIVETDSFSLYTVEFTYNNKEYVLDGDNYVKLYELLAHIGLTGEVSSWEVSNPSLFNIFKGTEDEVSYDYEIIDEYIYETPVNNPDGDVLYIVPLQMFNTEEWLKVTIDDIEYEIKVTDDNIYQTVPSSYSGNISTNNDDNVAMTGDTYFLNAPKPDYVMQSQSTTSATDFAAGLPLSTIFIDVSKIGHAENIGVQGEFTLLTENEAIRNGFEHYYTTDGSGSNANGLTGDVVVYNPLADTENLMQIEPNKINVLEGDLFQFIYRDAAILPNGNRAHVKMVYSNAKIAVDQRLGVTDTASGLTASNYQGAIYLARGGTVARGGSDERYLGWRNRTATQEPNQPFTQAQKQAMVNAVNNTISTNWGQSYTTSSMNSAETPVLGQSIDVKYQVVDDDGNPIDGTFIFAVTGVNLDRDPYAVSANNTAKPIWTYTKDDEETHFFSEAMNINQGKVSDYIYVRPNTNIFESNELKQKSEASNPPSKKFSYFYAQVIEDANGHVKFIGNGYNPSNLGGNDASYNAGFVVLANAKDGITITSTGHANSRLGMNTQAWGGVQIWYRYTSSTGPNGNIQTTSEGNYGGTLDDTSNHGVSSNILDPNTFVVPEGKTITYTLTPDENYQIAKLQVANSNGTMREIKYNGNKPLSSMREGDTYRFNDAAGRQCVLTALADGKFTLEVPYATHDEKFHVEWRRNNASVKIKKDTVDNKEGTFTFRIKAYKKSDVTTYSPILVGSIWKNSETGNYETSFIDGVTVNLTPDEIATILADATIDTKHFITGAEYTWGSYLGQTNINLSDIGVTYGEDDTLFVGFENIPTSLIGDNVGYALNTGYSAAGPERIYLYHPSTNVEKDVMTYWNFNLLKGQSSNPGWYTFNVNAGDEEELTVEEGYTYEVQEVNDANWQLLDIDGNPIQTASGELTSENRNPSHDFLNREVPDLTIKKETVKNVPGTFEFKIKAWTEEDETEKTKIGIYSCINSDGWSEVIQAEKTFTMLGKTFEENAHYTPNIDNNDIFVQNNRLDTVEENRTEYYDAILEFENHLPFNSDIHWGKPNAENIESKYYDIGLKATIEGADYDVYVQGDEESHSLFSTDNPRYMEVILPICVDLPTGDMVQVPIDLSAQLGTPDENGYYHFTLNSDESLTIPNLPYGCKYEVIEVEQDGWRLTNKINDSGSLEGNTTAKFINEKLLSLTIRKEADENTGEEFDFEVKIHGWKQIFSRIDGQPNPSGNSLPEIAHYKGVPYNSLPSYQVKAFVNNEEYAEGSLMNGDYHEDEDTWRIEVNDGAGYIDNEGFSNNGLDGDNFPSLITDFILEAENYINLEGNLSFDINHLAEKDGFYTFKLKAGEELIIPNIPYGYEYEIYEIDSYGNRVAVGDVFNTKWELKSATNTSGTLEETITSVFTNEIKRGSIKVNKETKGNEEGEFNFKAKVWKAVPGTIDNDYVDIDILYNVFVGNVFGTDLPAYGVYFDFEKTTDLNPPIIIDGYEIPNLNFIATDYSSVLEQIQSLSEDEQSYYDLESYGKINSIIEKALNNEDVSVIINGNSYQVVFQSDDTEEEIKTLRILPEYLDLSSKGGIATSEEGVYEFTINNGESFTIDEIPFGFKYEVYEETPEGWDLVSIDGLTPREKAEGTIASEEPYEHTFLNAKRHKLVFEKKVSGNMGDKYKEFEFEVKVYGKKLLFSDEVGEYLPANSAFGGTAGILFKNPELNQQLFKAHFDKFEDGNFTDLLNTVIIDTYCVFDTGFEYESPGNWDGYSLNNGDWYLQELSGEGVGNIGEHYSIDYPRPIEGIENTKQGAVFSPDWIDLEEYGGEHKSRSVFTFKLKHGDKIEIEVPYGYGYEIVEKDYSDEGYKQSVDGKEGREVSGELTEDKNHLFENRNQVAVPTEVRLRNMVIPGLSVIALILVYFIIKIKKRLNHAR